MTQEREVRDGYVVIPDLPKGLEPATKGVLCGKCGARFDPGKVYGYACPNGDCPVGFGPKSTL